jgi:hypothetical protein
MIEQDVNTDVDGVILARDISHRPDGAINGRVKSVVILGCEAENNERASHIPFRLVLVHVPEEPCNSKLAAFNPQFCRFASRLERHKPAICPAHETIRIFGRLYRPRI